MNKDELVIIQAIARSEIVHYSDISRLTGKSRKTISKYLDHIESEICKYGVKLFRKRNVGLYFEGDISKLPEIFDLQPASTIADFKNERGIRLLSYLLLASKPITVQTLADLTYVSRSTMESDLKEIKKMINQFHAKLQISHEGIKIVASERVRRQLMAELLTMYWGKTIYLGGQQEEVHVRIPSELKQFFNNDTLGMVIKSLDEFENVGTLKLSDYEYQSLAIHLVIGIERIRRHEVLHADHNDLHPVEQDTELLVQILERRFELKIPSDEIQYINIHILAAKETKSCPESETEITLAFDNNEISAFLKQNLKYYDAVLIQNLTLHLLPAIKRLALGLSLRNPYTAEVKKFFPLAYDQSVDLGIQIKNEFNVTLNDDELAYIALHIEAFNERKDSKITAVIVCSTGLGTARLLEQRIRKNFSDRIRITRVTSLQELKQRPVTEDIVISTINIRIPSAYVVTVPPFLDIGAIKKIDTAIQEMKADKPNPSRFMALIHRETIMFDDSVHRSDEVIRTIGKRLINTGYGNVGISNAAIAREKLASTVIGFIAIPHAPIDYVKKPCIVIYVDHAGVIWGDSTVRVVFFLAMNRSIQSNIEEIYSYFNSVLEDQKLLNRLADAKKSEEVIKLLGGDVFGNE